jgi:ABC-2 type transport system ATP-binding protein
MDEIEHRKIKEFEIKFKNEQDLDSFSKLNYEFKEKNNQKVRVKVVVEDKDINQFLKELNKYDIEYISEIKFTLEQYFMEYYKEGDN